MIRHAPPDVIYHRICASARRPTFTGSGLVQQPLARHERSVAVSAGKRRPGSAPERELQPAPCLLAIGPPIPGLNFPARNFSSRDAEQIGDQPENKAADEKIVRVGQQSKADTGGGQREVDRIA